MAPNKATMHTNMMIPLLYEEAAPLMTLFTRLQQ